jgi:hypothetical protein
MLQGLRVQPLLAFQIPHGFREIYKAPDLIPNDSLQSRYLRSNGPLQRSAASHRLEKRSDLKASDAQEATVGCGETEPACTSVPVF